jgi:hypothetical protein
MGKLLIMLGCLFLGGCDIDFVTDTVYVPTPVYYVEPCCYDYIEVWVY